MAGRRGAFYCRPKPAHPIYKRAALAQKALNVMTAALYLYIPRPSKWRRLYKRVVGHEKSPHDASRSGQPLLLFPALIARARFFHLGRVFVENSCRALYCRRFLSFVRA